jgi:hypothetical protein
MATNEFEAPIPAGPLEQDTRDEQLRPGIDWKKILKAIWKELRPYGAASWRHPPRGA